MSLKQLFIFSFLICILFPIQAMDVEMQKASTSSPPANNEQTTRTLNILLLGYPYFMDQDVHPLWKPKNLHAINCKIISEIINDPKIASEDIYTYDLVKKFDDLMDIVNQGSQEAISPVNQPLVDAIHQVLSSINDQKIKYLEQHDQDPKNTIFKRAMDKYGHETITLIGLGIYVFAVIFTYQLGSS